jgi:hypothetical protein
MPVQKTIPIVEVFMQLIKTSINKVINIDSVLLATCIERSEGEIERIEVTFAGRNEPEVFQGSTAVQIWDQLSKRAREKDLGHAYYELRLNGPLATATQKERRSLVLVSAISLLIAKYVLMPKDISAAGFSFLAPTRPSMIILLFLLLNYFIFSFSFRASNDCLLWLENLKTSKKVTHGLRTQVNYTVADLRNFLELFGSVALAVWAFRSLVNASLA